MLPPAGEQKPEDTQICQEPDTEVTGPPEAEGRGAGGLEKFFSCLEGGLNP